MLYQIVVFLHVLSVFLFLLAHGITLIVAFVLTRERDVSKIRVYLELSEASGPLTGLSLLAIIVFGVIAGFQANWWQFGWIWASIAILVVMVVLMAIYGANAFGKVRKAVGLPYRLQGKPFPAEPAQSEVEIEHSLKQIKPVFLTVIGYGGFAVITWLMMYKPF